MKSAKRSRVPTLSWGEVPKEFGEKVRSVAVSRLYVGAVSRLYVGMKSPSIWGKNACPNEVGKKCWMLNAEWKMLFKKNVLPAKAGIHK